MFENFWHKKEKPFAGFSGFGGGAAGLAGVGGPGKPAGPFGPPNGHDASGGMISDYTDPTDVSWRAHVFTHPGTFTISSLSGTHPADVEYLVVGAGGGGGWGQGLGGGGGAGQYLTDPAFSVSATSYPIVIGAAGHGGSPKAPGSVPPAQGGDGGNTTAFSAVSYTHLTLPTNPYV